MSGAEADFMAAGAPANQIHTLNRLRFVRFGRKTASIVRKIYFIVRNGQSRTKNKPETNARPAIALVLLATQRLFGDNYRD